MRKIAPILIVALLCLCFWFLLIRGCNKSGPDHSSDKAAVDSMVEKAKKDSITWGIKKDSIFKIIAFLQTGKDSLSKIISTYKVDLHKQGQDIQGLLNELDKAEKGNDTAAFFSGCDSLREQFASAKGLVGRYIISNDSLASTNLHIITQKDTLIGRLSLLYNEANNGLFDISRKYNLLYGDYQRINKPIKRWGIGPGIDIVYVNGGVKFAPSIGVHYNFIRF